MVPGQLLQGIQRIVYNNAAVVDGICAIIDYRIGCAFIQGFLCKGIAIEIATAQCEIYAALLKLTGIGLYQRVPAV